MGSSDVRPRKAPRQARARATVDAILAATEQVLVEEGYDRASTNRIAALAGVSVGSLYQYFPSKEALVAALLEAHVKAMMDELARGFMKVASAPLEEAARTLVKSMLDAHRQKPALHRVFAEQLPRLATPEDIHDVNRAAYTMVRSYLELRRAEIRAVDFDLAAFLIVQTVEAVTHAAVIDRPEALEEDLLVDELTTMLLNYLVPNRPAR